MRRLQGKVLAPNESKVSLRRLQLQKIRARRGDRDLRWTCAERWDVWGGPRAGRATRSREFEGPVPVELEMRDADARVKLVPRDCTEPRAHIGFTSGTARGGGSRAHYKCHAPSALNAWEAAAARTCDTVEYSPTLRESRAQRVVSLS